MITSQLLVWGAATITNFFKSGDIPLTAFQPVALRYNFNNNLNNGFIIYLLQLTFKY